MRQIYQPIQLIKNITLNFKYIVHGVKPCRVCFTAAALFIRAVFSSHSKMNVEPTICGASGTVAQSWGLKEPGQTGP